MSLSEGFCPCSLLFGKGRFMKYVYPAVFYKDEGKIGVTVPDIKGCHTFGDDMADAIEMTEDAISMMLVSFEDEGQRIPEASKISDIQTDENTIVVSLIVADTVKWREEFDNKAVKKTLTIPSWMNKKAEKLGINFSGLLQEALRKKIDYSPNYQPLD